MINNNYFPPNFLQAGLFHSLPNSSIFEIHIYVWSRTWNVAFITNNGLRMSQFGRWGSWKKILKQDVIKFLVCTEFNLLDFEPEFSRTLQSSQQWQLLRSNRCLGATVNITVRIWQIITCDGANCKTLPASQTWGDVTWGISCLMARKT